MSLNEIGKLLRDLAPYATLIVVLIGGWKVLQRINEAEQNLAPLAKDLEVINSLFVQVRLDAEKVGRSRPERVQGLEHYNKWDTDLVRSLMRSAKKRVWILQTWFPEMEADIHQWHFDHTKSLEIRILMADGSNPAVQERVRFRDDFRKDSDETKRKNHIAQMVSSCQTMIESTLTKNGIQTKEIMLYAQGMPFGPIYIIDDIVFFGIYPPHKNCNSAPMMRVPVDSDAGTLLRESFEVFWKSAKGVE